MPDALAGANGECCEAYSIVLNGVVEYRGPSESKVSGDNALVKADVASGEVASRIGVGPRSFFFAVKDGEDFPLTERLTEPSTPAGSP